MIFYYRGLKEYQNKTEKGYLIDTCLNAQEQYAREVFEIYVRNITNTLFQDRSRYENM